MQIGLIADIHGDLAGFQAALQLLDKTDFILCAGDIVDRGADADQIIKIFQERGIKSIKGNHEHSVLHYQERWRQTDKIEQLTQLGRIISDETVAYLQTLPDTISLNIENTNLLMAHGTPWSDITGIYPDSRQPLINQLVTRCPDRDILILGHTHQPMHLISHHLTILNPGSIYGVTIRDSHSCAMLTLPDRIFTVYDLNTGNKIEIPLVRREA